MQDAVGHDRFGGVRALALEIKNNVRRATGLTCSIGVTPNKLLSKIASDLDKPDGLTMLTHDDVPSADLAAAGAPHQRHRPEGRRSSWPRSASRASANWPRASRRSWSSSSAAATARWLHDASHGRDERAVVTHSEPVSMSRETTFDRDLHAKRDRAELSRVFTELCEQVAHDLQRKGYAGRTIGIKLRFDDFKTVTRDLTLPHPVDDAQAIRQAAGQCLKRVDLTRRIRLLGVRAGTLVRSRDLPAVAPDRPSDRSASCSPRPERSARRRSGAPRRQPPQPQRRRRAHQHRQPGHARRQRDGGPQAGDGHHQPRQLLGAQWHRTLGAPVAHDRPEPRVRQQPTFAALAATRKAERRQQHEGHGRQQRQKDADDAGDECQHAGGGPQQALPARSLPRGCRRLGHADIVSAASTATCLSIAQRRRPAMTVITNIEDLRVLAQRRVPRMFYDYADSGSWTEGTYRANESDFAKIKLRQRVAVEHREPQHRVDAWSASTWRCRWRSRPPA